ncbi:hypothetical protein EBI01_05590 [Marinomonas rhizomae]|uniref:Apea-like HEPN domain-containing protein n=1 Tax=Marinomonas rhizomae TaxID=491948 RepID=A0A366JCW3_9GAMM|nr:hypothetical protein [Marinomonas rhizomae]RBP84250.1 hypothetical protein DFP80_104153 [Marinomonas rhizomae]RNF74572.1 hypothetical protein EBI01_05590 [Marinomonas rhizomae]
MNLVCYLSNFVVSGIEITETKTGGYVRNKISFSVAGLSIEIYQAPEFINAKKSDLKGQFVKSTKLVVKNIEEDDRERALGVVDRISVLLSFAICSEVSFYAWNIEGNNRARTLNVRGKYHYFRPPLSCVDTSDIKHLIESCFDIYFNVYRERDLNVVVDLLNTPEINNFQLELKLATLFILLENLKSSYAKVKGLKYNQGNYFSSDEKKYTFQSLLKEMFNSVDMDVNLKDIKNLRNEIIHSGLSHLSYANQYSIYATCRDVITEYILRLIGYKGCFSLYESRGVQWKEIT